MTAIFNFLSDPRALPHPPLSRLPQGATLSLCEVLSSQQQMTHFSESPGTNEHKLRKSLPETTHLHPPIGFYCLLWLLEPSSTSCPHSAAPFQPHPVFCSFSLAYRCSDFLTLPGWHLLSFPFQTSRQSLSSVLVTFLLL